MCIVSHAKHSICLIFFLAETRHNWSNFKIRSFSSSNSSFPLLRKSRLRLRLRLSHLLPPSRSWRVAPCRQAPSTTPGPSSSSLLRVPTTSGGPIGYSTQSSTSSSSSPLSPQRPTDPSAASPFRSSSSSRHCPREAAWSLPARHLSRRPPPPFLSSSTLSSPAGLAQDFPPPPPPPPPPVTSSPLAQTPPRPSRPLPVTSWVFWCRCFRPHHLHHQWMHWGCPRVMAQCEYPQSSVWNASQMPLEGVQSSA